METELEEKLTDIIEWLRDMRYELKDGVFYDPWGEETRSSIVVQDYIKVM